MHRKSFASILIRAACRLGFNRSVPRGDRGICFVARRFAFDEQTAIGRTTPASISSAAAIETKANS
jgi:hypothetical protein